MPELHHLINRSNGRLRLRPFKQLLGYYRYLKSPKARAEALADSIESFQMTMREGPFHYKTKIPRI